MDNPQRKNSYPSDVMVSLSLTSCARMVYFQRVWFVVGMVLVETPILRARKSLFMLFELGGPGGKYPI